MTVLTDAQRKLLQELIYARGPVGLEAEVAAICYRELARVADEAWIDEMGNAVGVVRAPNANRERAAAKAVRLMAHMDEIALIVKRVNPNGHLRVVKLGGLLPISFGQVPVDIMGDEGPVPGILSIGPLHVTKETANFTDTNREVLHWEDVFVATRLTREELFARGVHAGSPVAVGRYLRHLFEFEDCIAAHFMDDRALIVVGLEAFSAIAAERARLRRDVYMVCTVQEEVTCAGAQHAARTLPGDEVIALEVGPVAAEYDTELSERPIVLYGDMRGTYSRAIVERLKSAVAHSGVEPQLALFENFATDASSVLAAGNAAAAGALCVPTQNTHGFEIIQRHAIPTAAAALTTYLLADQTP